MTLVVPTVEDFDAISSLFEVLAEWASETGGTALLPWTSEWQDLGANTAWAVRVLSQNDGTLQFQAALQNQLYLDLQSGTGKTKVLHSVDTRIDMESAIMTVTTNDDGGVQREDIFDNDKRVAIRYTDLGGTMPWANVVNLYNDIGQRTEKITNLDDGRQRQDLFENGLRTTTILTDFSDENAFVWDTITSEYDVNGQRISKTTVYDDGSERAEKFVGGVRSAVSRTDASNETWETIETVYTQFGDLDARTISFDDGLVREERFLKDQLVAVSQSDALNAYDWTSIDRTYDALGKADRNETLFDDGDITIMIYNDGARDTRIELDTDGDEAWVYRVTHYDKTGVRAVETYFEGDEFIFDEFGNDTDPPPIDQFELDVPPVLPESFELDLLA